MRQVQIERDIRGHSAVDLVVVDTDGRRYEKRLDTAPGFPGRPLSDAEHRSRFDECIDYAEIDFPRAQADELAAVIGDLDDVRSLIALLVAPRLPSRT